MLSKQKNSIWLLEKESTVRSLYLSRWMKKSCLIEFNWIIIENMLQIFPHKEHYHRLILLHYLNEFQEPFKNAISFVKLTYLCHLGNKVLTYNVYVFTLWNTIRYRFYWLYEKEGANPKFTTERLLWKIKPWQSFFFQIIVPKIY